MTHTKNISHAEFNFAVIFVEKLGLENEISLTTFDSQYVIDPSAEMMRSDAFEEPFQTRLRDIPRKSGNMKASTHETLEKLEAPKLPGPHEDVMRQDHEPEAADNGRPFVGVPGFHERH